MKIISSLPAQTSEDEEKSRALICMVAYASVPNEY